MSRASLAVAHELKLETHPYVFRADALPDVVSSFEELLRALLVDAGVGGVFSDQPDRAVAFLRSLGRQA